MQVTFQRQEPLVTINLGQQVQVVHIQIQGKDLLGTHDLDQQDPLATNNEEKTLIVKETSSDKEASTDHENQDSNESDKEFQHNCKECQRSFNSLRSLKIH